jgi:hypothetical protein
MLLLELFDQPDDSSDLSASFQDGDSMKQRLRQAALDIITPMLGQNLPFVTVQQVIDGLSHAKFGIVITPALVMDILNPKEVKSISRIEGDRIYLEDPTSADRETDEKQEQRDDEHVNQMAVDQINNDLKQK